jgi:D-alanyl-D-alanine carboxypeptidase
VTKSANDVAATVGENLGGSEANFAVRMTKTARALGMNKTVFKNASGLPNPAQVTTARDIATLSLRVQRDFPEYYPYFRTTSFTFRGQTIRSHNRLIGKFAGTDGIKTGYIAASGFNLTTSAKRGDKRVVGVVLGSASGSARDKYMMKMLEKHFPKCVDGKTIAASVGGVDSTKPKTISGKNAGEKTPQAVADPFKTVLDAEAEPSPDDTKVLEARIAEAAGESLEAPEGNTIANPNLPANLPFAVKPQAAVEPAEGSAAPPETSASVIDPTWKIQIGAYPKKEEAKQKLQQIKSSGYQFLEGKQAFTVEVQKGKETIYRARFSGFTQKTAKAACSQLSKKGMECMTLSPQS